MKLIPNSTQIPNVILDLLLPELPEAETKCLLYICRRTFGFHKEKDTISFSQFMKGIKDKRDKVLDKGTGLNRSSVKRAIKTLEYANIVRIRRIQGRESEYELNLSVDVENAADAVKKCRKMMRAGWVGNPRAQRLFPAKHTQSTKEPGIQKHPVPSPPKHPVPSPRKNPTKERETKGNKVQNMRPAKTPSAHQQFVEYFYNLCQSARRVKPIITGKDGRNLQRVLKLNLVSQQELEQMALYFLASAQMRKFSPSISTFLSAGIFTGLVNTMRQGGEFWKELDMLARRHTVNVQPFQSEPDLVNRIAQLREKLSMSK